MAAHSEEYLTTRELADLLRIKERKVYYLAASGDIPCTRALGKLLFERSAIDNWLASHASGVTAPPTSIPTVFLDSHDPLLEWSLRESNSGIATFLDGSLDGLERFARGEGIATGLHVFDRETMEWNIPAVRQKFAGKPIVLVEWAWRERGLIIAPQNPKKITGISALKEHRIVSRQAEAGSQVLLDHLLSEAGLKAGSMQFTHPARTETDAALMVLEGEADAAFGLLSAAKQCRLDFVPVIRERFDLLVWRSEWFEEPFQKFLKLCGSAAFQSRANSLTGYDVSRFCHVHHNEK